VRPCLRAASAQHCVTPPVHMPAYLPARLCLRPTELVQIGFWSMNAHSAVRSEDQVNGVQVAATCMPTGSMHARHAPLTLRLRLARRSHYLLGWLVFTAATSALTVFAVACCMLIAPAAAGSGIPDVVAYLNGVDVPSILLFRTLVAKILGSLGSVGGGLAVGKEGPFVHIGACIASVLSQVRAALCC
jgi:H+/Cl- antiporter ClcA